VGALDGFQALTLEHFEDALDLANAARPVGLQGAIDRFDALRKVVGGNLGYYKTAEAKAEIQKVLEEAPNHATAQVIAEALGGLLPKTISMGGSYDAINEAWKPMQLAVASGEFQEGSSLEEDLYATTASRLNRLRPILHPDAQELSDAVMELANELKTFRRNPPISPAGIQEAVFRIDGAATAIDEEMERFGEKLEVEYRD
jgi:hypothetical protein